MSDEALLMPKRVSAPVAAALLGLSVPSLYGRVDAGALEAEKLPGARGVTVALSEIEAANGRHVWPADLCKALAVAEARTERARNYRATTSTPNRKGVAYSSEGAATTDAHEHPIPE